MNKMIPTIQKIELYEIPLLKDFGYFYAKVLYFLIEEQNFMGFMVRVYDSYHKESMYKNKERINKDLFKTDDYYTYPFRLWRKPRRRGKHKWFFIEELPISECDKKLPDFTSMTLKQETGRGNDNDLKSVVKNFFGIKVKINTYKNTKHLIPPRITYDDYVRAYITLLWLIEKDFNDELLKHPRDNFSTTLIEEVVKNNFTDEEISDPLLSVTFNDIQRRRRYTTIPKEIRDKAIEH